MSVLKTCLSLKVCNFVAISRENCFAVSGEQYSIEQFTHAAILFLCEYIRMSAANCGKYIVDFFFRKNIKKANKNNNKN